MSERPRPSRSRSRSPYRHETKTHRTRSPHRHHHGNKRKPTEVPLPKTLPFGSRQLTKRDLEVFKPMFTLYLDIQKGKDIEELVDKEVGGRWKSFIGKWNRGELSEEWYDPSTLQKATTSNSEPTDTVRYGRESARRRQTSPGNTRTGRQDQEIDGATSSDDEIGPSLPNPSGRGYRQGPSIPSMQDLTLRREQATEDALHLREYTQHERKLDRANQKARLEELVPRAEAGTRERQLEKKKEVNEKIKSFRERSPGMGEVGDSELMGGGEDDIKMEKKEFERKKNEREIRKEEILRARQAEREERLSGYREKEDETMRMLKALAKSRFG